VVGPSPLPPSEAIFTMDGTSRLAFLPSIDLAPGDSALFAIAADGSTRRRFAAAEETPSRVPYADRGGRGAGEVRAGVPGRLRFASYVLRQRVYGTRADALVFPDGDDVIGLDPRSGCVVISPGAPPGPITATYRVGRGAAIGA